MNRNLALLCVVGMTFVAAGCETSGSLFEAGAEREDVASPRKAAADEQSEHCDTPLPAIVAHPAAAPDAPAEAARFANWWHGWWSSGHVCQQLVVHYIDDEGRAYLTYGWRSNSAGAANPEGGYRGLIGIIEGDRLSIDSGSAQFYYTLADDGNQLDGHSIGGQGKGLDAFDTTGFLSKLPAEEVARRIGTETVSCETPLPDPLPRTNGNSSFLHRWQGKWSGQTCHQLVVTSVEPDGTANVIWSFAKTKRRPAGYVARTGTVTGNTLSVQVSSTARASYILDPRTGTLNALLRGETPAGVKLDLYATMVPRKGDAAVQTRSDSTN